MNGFAEPEINLGERYSDVDPDILKFIIARAKKIKQKSANGNEYASELISTFRKYTIKQTKENADALVVAVKAYKNSLKNFRK